MVCCELGKLVLKLCVSRWSRLGQMRLDILVESRQRIGIVEFMPQLIVPLVIVLHCQVELQQFFLTRVLELFNLLDSLDQCAKLLVALRR